MFKNEFLRQRFGKIILASASPRRANILKQVGFDFQVISSDVEEVFVSGDPVECAKELASRKASVVAERFSDRIVIGADTIVYLENRILGKPQNADEASAMLEFLSGRTHHVYTAFTLLQKSKNVEVTDVEMTEVTFRQLLPDEIKHYIASDAPLDKAGAYGIQDESAVFVERINGDFYNVVGLPITKIYSALHRFF
jgi:septum formation protein